jgi:hypothetical protein
MKILALGFALSIVSLAGGCSSEPDNIEEISEQAFGPPPEPDYAEQAQEDMREKLVQGDE